MENEIPKMNKGDIIKISGKNYSSIKAEVVEIYTEEIKEKLGDFCGDIAIVYKETGSRGVKTDAIWDGSSWIFKNSGPSGSYVSLNSYPQLK